ncbi:hypothetical protein [Mesorhizobium sp.]|uniref:hypothetical protein n=1 Tax=Mesorhizobium sp. TaxID=1871066 RepID=UPI0025E48F0F|nr:hypothetical protein [Mesorhizobium sp.]
MTLAVEQLARRGGDQLGHARKCSDRRRRLHKSQGASSWQPANASRPEFSAVWRRQRASKQGYKAHRWNPLDDVLRKFEIGVDTPNGPDYIRPTNEGGAPLAAEKFASKSALCEIQESRVSDTRGALEREAKRAETLRLRCLIFDN